MINLHSVFQTKVTLLLIFPWTHSLLNLFHLFLDKYKKPIKNKVKTLLQENPLLNETDSYEDDLVSTRIPH